MSGMGKVLVVDDSVVARRLMGGFLDALGLEATFAHDGEAGLATLETLLPAVLLVDWNMPGMNGDEFVGAVRSSPRFDEIPIIMVTTENDVSHIAAAFERGANEFLMKPFDLEALRSKLELVGVLA